MSDKPEIETEEGTPGTGGVNGTAESKDGDGDDMGEVAIEVEGDDQAAAEAGEGSAADALQAAEAKYRETYDRLLRATADLDNYRKRSRREIEDARFDGRARTLKEVLPVIDNLERALQHGVKEGQDDAASKSIIDGVELVLRQFAQALERVGAVAIDALHKPFDPAVHEAVSQAPSAEYPPGTVVAELQKGYQIGDRLLRPTLAVVSVGAPAGDGTESENDASETNGEVED